MIFSYIRKHRASFYFVLRNITKMGSSYKLVTRWLRRSASFCRNDIVFRRVLLHGIIGLLAPQLIWIRRVSILRVLFKGHITAPKRRHLAFQRKYRSSSITVGLLIFEMRSLYTYNSHNYTRGLSIIFISRVSFTNM